MISDKLEISIIIPSKNDEKIFLKNVESIKKYFQDKEWNYELILVSNGSTQENIDEIIKLEKKDFKYISIEQSGKGLAIKKGIEHAKYEYILFMDADFSVKISELNKFINNHSPLGEVMVGSRRTRNSINKGTPLLRNIGGSVYLFLIKLLFDINLTDTQCGFKLFKSTEYLKFKHNLSYDNFSFDIEMLYYFSQNNKIVEIPVNYIHHSDSKVSFMKDSLAMFFDLIKLRLR